MDFIQFWVRLFWMILAMFLNLKALERYVTFRKAWWAKPLAFLAYWGVAGTIDFCGRLGKSALFHCGFFYRDASAGGDGVLKTVTVCVSVFQSDVCVQCLDRQFLERCLRNCRLISMHRAGCFSQRYCFLSQNISHRKKTTSFPRRCGNYCWKCR